MLIPQLHPWFDWVVNQWVPASSGRGDGFLGGIALGAVLGLAWTPCVGPVIASVMTRAISHQIDGGAIVTTLAFALGTALPMAAVSIGGRRVVTRLRWFQVYGRNIQQVFGALLIITAVAIWLGLDRSMQAVLVELLPNWDQALTRW